MTKKKDYEPPRTFGDLLKPEHRHLWISYASDAVPEFRECRFCKADSMDTPLAKYSTRHYVCDNCIKQRQDTLLPAVRESVR